MWVVVWLIAAKSYTPTTQDTFDRPLYACAKAVKYMRVAACGLCRGAHVLCCAMCAGRVHSAAESRPTRATSAAHPRNCGSRLRGGGREQHVINIVRIDIMRICNAHAQLYIYLTSYMYCLTINVLLLRNCVNTTCTCTQSPEFETTYNGRLTDV